MKGVLSVGESLTGNMITGLLAISALMLLSAAVNHANGKEITK